MHPRPPRRGEKLSAASAPMRQPSSRAGRDKRDAAIANDQVGIARTPVVDPIRARI
eukprot:SAG31_NODE_1116_length_9830_cov_11.188470_2_plen_56_part_00